MNGVGVHLHFIEAVFKRIGDPHGGMRQLASLAYRHEAGRALMRHRAAENEAARLDAGDLVDLVTRPWMHQFIDRTAEGARVAEQRGDVAKQDTRLGIIWNGADGGLQIIFKSHRFLFSISSSLRAQRSNPEDGRQGWIASSQGLLAMTSSLNRPPRPAGTRSPRCAGRLRRRATSAIPDEIARRRPARSCARLPWQRRPRYSPLLKAPRACCHAQHRANDSGRSRLHWAGSPSAARRAPERVTAVHAPAERAGRVARRNILRSPGRRGRRRRWAACCPAQHLSFWRFRNLPAGPDPATAPEDPSLSASASPARERA